MAFTVEDGTGLVAANAFVEVAFVDAYHKDRSNPSWTGSITEKQSAIIRASDYITGKFHFRGLPINDTQGVSWPRIGVYTERGAVLDAASVPDELMIATAILAVPALTVDLDPDNLAGRVRQQSEKFGPISKSVTFFSEASPVYGKTVDVLHLLLHNQGSLPLMRA